MEMYYGGGVLWGFTAKAQWHTLCPPPLQPTASQRLSEALMTARGLVDFGRTLLPVFFLFFFEVVFSRSSSLLMPANTFIDAGVIIL